MKAHRAEKQIILILAI